MSASETDAGAVADAAAGAVARDLLGLRSVVEVESRLLESVLTQSGASWAAIYRPSDSGYRRSSVEGSTRPSLPRKLATAFVDALLEPGDDVLPVEGARDREMLAGAALRAGMTAETEIRSILLLVGPPALEMCDEAEKNALQAVTDVCARALRNADLIERLSSQVFVDFVTGVFNRRAFEEHLGVELERARRYDRPVSILFLDLDGFKAVNDTYGHAVGDDALKRVAEVLRHAFRTSDRVCRYGGDEFAVVFPETAKEDVIRLAERLRKQVAAIWAPEEHGYGLTASIGVASYPSDGRNVVELVQGADRALYRAKSGGRNQVAST
jgi:diguanylate cyclase (GGDEF)-like protein